ncbi:hypothetical protein B9K06_23345 [Bacillus sp. OG2]|nr:hypothetical protein B9K06_23345 [Bacillus sp. OG2]
MWGKRWKWKFEWSGALNLGFGAFFVLWGWFAGGSAGSYLRVWEDICGIFDIFATGGGGGGSVEGEAGWKRVAAGRILATFSFY